MMLKPIQSKPGEPIWELARQYPNQGEWSEQDYFALETDNFVEFDNGYLEFLPIPTLVHQRIMLFLYRLLHTFVEARALGEVLTAPLPVRLWNKKYRETDIIFLSSERRISTEDKYPTGADMVVEIVSEGKEDRERDLETKREEYALAGIAEYWVIDPKKRQIWVLKLVDDEYVVHGQFKEGERATSVLLAGFGVEVTAVFAAADPHLRVKK
ncbi:MAG TPA: Uma2 family endonuclease [Chloroflexota bacterium]|nr:Uma2 family endonuclease [Chloroflexota bacterium]